MTERSLSLCLLGIIVADVLVGCSHFKPKKYLDMGRFAEDMIAVAGEIQYSLGQQQAIYLRDYNDAPELLPVRKEAERARRLVRGVIAYSIQLVTLGDSRKPEVDKAAALADYLEGVVPVQMEGQERALGLTRAQVDTILADVRTQEQYLDAIAAAQPLVDEVAIASGQIFDDLKAAMDVAINSTRRRIEDRYRDIRAADELLKQRQIQTVYNIAFLQPIRLGVPGALDSLIAREPSLPGLVNARDGLDAKEIQRIEDRMLDILRRLSEVRKQLEPDIDMYFKQQRELDDLDAVWNAELRKGRIAVVAWARAHKRMAGGMIDPADIDVIGIARKASGKLMP